MSNGSDYSWISKIVMQNGKLQVKVSEAEQSRREKMRALLDAERDDLIERLKRDGSPRARELLRVYELTRG